MKRIFAIIISIQFFTSLWGQTPEFILPSIISDHAVMQRNSEVKLWGWCPGAWDLKIVCSWAPQDTIHVKSNEYCAWEAYIQTPDLTGPHSIRFYGWENKLEREINDILMGETWLCSGQSNMEYLMSYPVLDAGDITKAIENKNLRFFKVSKATSKYPVERIEGKWVVCSSDTYKDFSAVAFFFGQHLNENLNIPIGLIGSYWGGTSIEPWIDQFSFNHEKELYSLSPKQHPESWTPTANSSIYNAMIHPVKNYTIAGVIWYQGEGNNERAASYGTLLDGMIRGWRNEFHRYLPFYFVQIAPWNGYADKNAAYLREQQSDVAATLKNTGMVVVGDLVNDISDIHPSLKKQVGVRLANMVLYQTYGKKDIQPYSPQLDSIRIEKNKIVVATTAIGKLTCKDKVIRNFEVVDKEGNIYPADAKIEKNGEISVSSSKIKEPIAVRYCFANDAIPNLFDINGLPLAPFRTDRKK